MSEQRCPVCGKGVLIDVSYRAGETDESGQEIQEAESRQVETYSCGHEVVGPRLEATADDQALDVEHRTSEEAAEEP
jgi:hypothetical protein